MQSHSARLDRFIARQNKVSRRDVRVLIAQGRVEVDGERASTINQVVGQFSRVTVDERVLQDCSAHYLMLHKPCGVVSATHDEQHRTVIDLLPQPYAQELHIAGRLDFNSSGLLLLTNDGRWSRALSEPEGGIVKTYRVQLENPLDDAYVAAFAEGMHFPYEGITTRPAQLTILSSHEAQVRLVEGRYHQIKRMFGRFRNRVLSLHRSAVGELALDPTLAPGESRALGHDDLAAIGVPHNLDAAGNTC